MKNLNEKLSQALEIEPLQISPKEDNPEFKNDSFFYNEDSKNLYNMLLPEDIEFIKSINKFDLYIYNNDNQIKF